VAIKALVTIPHVFAPKEGSLYSSQTESKRAVKQQALEKATVENLCRHGANHWVHASLGKSMPVVNREQSTADGIDLTIQVYSPANASLAGSVSTHPQLKWINTDVEDYTQVPMLASRRALEQAGDYDIVGYMEDDLLIEDQQFFAKLHYLHTLIPDVYAPIPHRCEYIPNHGDVILSGDPDGGRPDLFWDTGETIEVQWPLGNRRFYRATNPHSGCYFLSQTQARMVEEFWSVRSWTSPFMLSGPLEQAGSGVLLPVLKVMKPVPEHYRFLMVRHQDALWTRHAFEQGSPEQDAPEG
jgi:hypothetical protein